MILFFIVLIIVVAVWMTISRNNKAKETARVAQINFDYLKDFNASKKYACEKRPEIIAIDENRREVAMAVLHHFKSTQERLVYAKVVGIRALSIPENIRFPFKDILSIELAQDDESIFKKSASRLIGGALIGDALGGRAGALIGGLSGGSRQKVKVQSVDLIITVKSLSNPLHKFRFFDSPRDTFQKEVPSSSPVYLMAFNAAKEWQALFSVIIDQENNSQNQTS